MAKMVLGKDPLDKIVDDYVDNYKSSLSSVLTAHSALPKAQQTNSWVRGLHITNNRPQLGHSHQNRIPKTQKQGAINALNSVTYTSNIKDFEDLFEWVYNVLKNKGVIKNRCVWVYDIAMRMGQCMSPKIEPKDYVYLYNGAYDGAVALNKTLPNGKKIKITNHRAAITSFPAILQQEGAIYIEDIMCVYHPKK